MRPEYDFWLLQMVINQNNNNSVIIYQYDLIAKHFWRSFVSIAKFSYWFKFHVNIIIVSLVMTIFFYRRLTRNPETTKTPVWVWINIWRLRQVRDTKLGIIVCNYMSLNAEKFQHFYCFLVIKGKPTRVGIVKLSEPPFPD